MRRLLVAFLAVALAAEVFGHGARADDWVVLPAGVSVLPAAAPNGPGLLFPPDLSTPPAGVEKLTPEQLRPIWQAAGDVYGIPWQVLGAINKVESDFGKNMGPSSAGAVGWMQFMPSTWLQYGTDANADGVADPWNPHDAVYSAARYLAAAGAETDLRGAVYAYNHADWYVDEVLQLAASYGLQSSPFTDPEPAAPTAAVPPAETAKPVSTAAEEQGVADAEAALSDGLARVAELEQARSELEPNAPGEGLLGDRLSAAQDLAASEAELADARARVTELRDRVAVARASLEAARERAAAPELVAVDPVPAAPIRSGAWVFPVGGGPAIVAVTPQKDASTTEISAPAGTPVYALASGQVETASPDPSGDCGIGLTLQAQDGRSWTYCHLAYLEASVAPGASVEAGAQIGLAGQTGSAAGPGLSVLSAAGSPALESEAWVADLDGKAFRRQGVPPSETAAPLFAVVPS